MTRPLEPLELLFEAGEPRSDLPEALRELYGGSLELSPPLLYANFVSTVDGVVALPAQPRSNRLIGDWSEADRFVMGLLRAFADVVLVGSGTLRGSPRAIWTAEDAYPPAAAEFSELRRRLGRPAQPELAILTASGAIEAEHPALGAGAVVLTTERGAARLRGRLAAGAEIVSLPGEGAVDVRAAVELLRARGHELILSESGPTVLGSLLAAGLVDELFLTLSPVLAGRSAGGRPGLVEGVELLPGTRVAGRLASVRRRGAHLFLRYGIELAGSPPGP